LRGKGFTVHLSNLKTESPDRQKRFGLSFNFGGLMSNVSVSPDPVTAIADLLRVVLEPLGKELENRYTTKYTENARDLSEEMRKYPNQDSAKCEALMQDQVDIFVKVKQEIQNARASTKP
jgi:hypothetical protein